MRAHITPVNITMTKFYRQRIDPTKRLLTLTLEDLPETLFALPPNTPEDQCLQTIRNNRSLYYRCKCLVANRVATLRQRDLDYVEHISSLNSDNAEAESTLYIDYATGDNGHLTLINRANTACAELTAVINIADQLIAQLTFNLPLAQFVNVIPQQPAQEPPPVRQQNLTQDISDQAQRQSPPAARFSETFTTTTTSATVEQTAQNSSKPQQPQPQLSPCAFCHNSHYADHCMCFPTSQSRTAFCIQHRLCFCCLTTGHATPNCKMKRSCCYCQKNNHHSALCRLKFGDRSHATEHASSNETELGETSDTMPVITMAVNHQVRQVKSRLMTSTTTQQQPNNYPEQSRLRILYDSGSMETFLAAEVTKTLDLPILHSTEFNIQKFGGHTTKIHHCKSNQTCFTPKAVGVIHSTQPQSDNVIRSAHTINHDNMATCDHDSSITDNTDMRQCMTYNQPPSSTLPQAVQTAAPPQANPTLCEKVPIGIQSVTPPLTTADPVTNAQTTPHHVTPPQVTPNPVVNVQATTQVVAPPQVSPATVVSEQIAPSDDVCVNTAATPVTKSTTAETNGIKGQPAIKEELEDHRLPQPTRQRANKDFQLTETWAHALSSCRKEHNSFTVERTILSCIKQVYPHTWSFQTKVIASYYGDENIPGRNATTNSSVCKHKPFNRYITAFRCERKLTSCKPCENKSHPHSIVTITAAPELTLEMKMNTAEQTNFIVADLTVVAAPDPQALSTNKSTSVPKIFSYTPPPSRLLN